MVNKATPRISNRMKYWLFSFMVTTILLSLNEVSAKSSKDNKDWEFMIEPYLLAANIKGSSSLRGLKDVDVDISASDIFDNLKMGGMIRAEALYKKNLGLAFDFAFMDLETDIPFGRNGNFIAGIKQSTIELLCFKRKELTTGAVDFFVGARHWKNKIKATIDPGLAGSISLQKDENWVDAVIGVRGYFDIAEDWQLMVRGDIGGFGLESDFTAKTVAGVMYNITDSIILDVQYIALWVDYETGTRNTTSFFSYDTVTHGPALGMIFKF